MRDLDHFTDTRSHRQRRLHNIRGMEVQIYSIPWVDGPTISNTTGTSSNVSNSSNRRRPYARSIHNARRTTLGSTSKGPAVHTHQLLRRLGGNSVQTTPHKQRTGNMAAAQQQVFQFQLEQGASDTSQSYSSHNWMNATSKKPSQHGSLRSDATSATKEPRSQTTSR